MSEAGGGGGGVTINLKVFGGPWKSNIYPPPPPEAGRGSEQFAFNHKYVWFRATGYICGYGQPSNLVQCTCPAVVVEFAATTFIG